jgi:hypothetical protein
MTSITDSIEALSDDEAIRALAETADYQVSLPDPAQLRALETSLRDAASHDTELAGYAQPGSAADAGDLACTTLAPLAATRPDLVPVTTRAISDPRLRRPRPGHPHR